MSAYKSDFLDVLASRGFIHQLSDAAGLDARAAQGAITAYVGFDATAPSLHIGNLLSIMLLRLFQQTGNRPIVLMGHRDTVFPTAPLPHGRSASTVTRPLGRVSPI